MFKFLAKCFSTVLYLVTLIKIGNKGWVMVCVVL